MGDWGNNDSWNVGSAGGNTFSANDEWNANAFSGGDDQWTGGAGAPVGDAFNDGTFSGKASSGFGGNAATGGTGAGGVGGACFNCNKEGHVKSECIKPRKFSGTCNNCGEQGEADHQARSCPSKPKVCKQCLAEDDHDTIDCKNKKVVDNSRVPDLSEGEAWNKIKEASDDIDIDDFKDAVKILSKANPGITYPDLEKEFRKRDLNIYLIGLEKEVGKQFVNVNLQGEVGKTYTLGYYTSSACQRPVLKEMWPKDAADNLARLGDSGIPLERGVPICGNCNELGHVRKDCSQQREVVEGVKIMCALCNEEGHRIRDCTQERPKKKGRACRVCESEDHVAADCPDKPKVECRNCLQEGHRAGDCTNERVMKCRNCDGIGHAARECKEAKDWAKHKCRHCGEFGHGSENRCAPGAKEVWAAKQAEKEAAGGGDGYSFDAAADGFDTGAAGVAEWGTTPAPVVVGSGGW